MKRIEIRLLMALSILIFGIYSAEARVNQDDKDGIAFLKAVYRADKHVHCALWPPRFRQSIRLRALTNNDINDIGRSQRIMVASYIDLDGYSEFIMTDQGRVYGYGHNTRFINNVDVYDDKTIQYYMPVLTTFFDSDGVEPASAPGPHYAEKFDHILITFLTKKNGRFRSKQVECFLECKIMYR